MTTTFIRNDVSSLKEARYHQFCSEKPLAVYTMEQNVGLVMFRLPIEGEGFKLRVRFKQNPQRESIARLRAQRDLCISSRRRERGWEREKERQVVCPTTSGSW